MHIAQVTEWGQPPKYVEADTPAQPTSDSGDVQVKVKAVGLHQVVRSRASGQHYSSTALPHIPGTDGVGTTADGKTVFFSSFAKGATYSDVVNVSKSAIFLLPPGVDELQVAAFTNPGISSWMALKARTTELPPNFSILIMGATSASGTMAISVARAFGAGKVIGCARNVDKLLTLGLDEIIQLQDPVTETDFSKLGDIDVILDYLYGPPTEHLLKSLESSHPVQYVHIGGLAGKLDISLPGAVLRSKNLTIRGSGPGSFSTKDMAAEVPKLLEAFVGFKPIKLKVVPLSKVESVWNEGGDRTVFVPEE